MNSPLQTFSFDIHISLCSCNTLIGENHNHLQHCCQLTTSVIEIHASLFWNTCQVPNRYWFKYLLYAALALIRLTVSQSLLIYSHWCWVTIITPDIHFFKTGVYLGGTRIQTRPLLSFLILLVVVILLLQLYTNINSYINTPTGLSYLYFFH